MIAELVNISKSYPLPGQTTGNEVLDKINLKIPEMAAIAITGPSGSGKSTLLNILGTLDTPTSGELLIEGHRVTYDDPKRLADLRNNFTGFIFQLHHLLPQLTLIENILLPTLPLKEAEKKKEAAESAEQLMNMLGISKLHDQFPGRLSVGECQRAAVVRALINRPGLLLADEPTGSLDHRNAMILAELLKDLQEKMGFALVMVTHSLEIAAGMSIKYNLDSGQLHEY